MQDGKITAASLEKVMRKPYFIPSSTSLFSQLQLFQENQKRVGIVVDEYGEWLGLVTLEDIIEEIIGEFTTQAPTQTSTFIKESGGSVIVEGSTLLRELNHTQFSLDGPKTQHSMG